MDKSRYYKVVSKFETRLETTKSMFSILVDTCNSMQNLRVENLNSCRNLQVDPKLTSIFCIRSKVYHSIELHFLHCDDIQVELHFVHCLTPGPIS